MSLRFKILLVALVAAILPLAAIQLLRQAEVLLREAQQQSQIAAAQAMVQAIKLVTPTLPPAGRGIFITPAASAPRVDGSRQEWSTLATQGPALTEAALQVTLLEHRNTLYLLIEVADSSRVRGEIHSGAHNKDALYLTYRTANGEQTLQLGNAAPGSLRALNAQGQLVALRGEWQETAAGYRIEMALPELAKVESLSFRVRDYSASTAVKEIQVDELPLLRVDTELANRMALLVPPQSRIRYLSSEGWVLARAGGLAESTEVAAQENQPEQLAYQVLLAPELDEAGEFESSLQKLNAPEVWQALSGIPASSVRAASGRGRVVVSSAAPVTRDGQVIGAVLLERVSDALLLKDNRTITGLMIATLVAVFAAAGLLFGYAGFLSWRIRRLRNAAERALRPDGRVDAQFPYASAHSDLGDLSRSFSRLLEEIGSYNAYLQTLASKLSHELNTPLAIVRSSLDNLEQFPLSSEAKVYSDRARDGAERLAGLLRSLSEAKRIEQAIANSESEQFDLTELVRACANGYRDVAGNRRVVLDLPDHATPFFGVPDLIAQALDKLFDNAISFTAEQGWIRIKLRAHDDHVLLSVANQGPLLPAHLGERLFESLVSVRESQNSLHLGLGLHIVRLIAELHQGTAHAKNLPLDEGVEIELRLRGCG